MKAVDKVDVDGPGRSVHHLGPHGPAPRRVAGQVMRPQLGLDFGDDERNPFAAGPAHKHFAQKVPGDNIGLASVESCTAGSLAHLLSQAEGASDTLHGGFVVYTKANKIAAVGVPQELLTSHTAVSAEVATAMAEGGLSRCPADVVVSITGVAGPEPDEDGNPVGLVYVAAVGRDGRRRVARHAFGKRDREEICTAAMEAALTLVEELLTEQPS